MLTDAFSHANENDTTDTSPTFKVLEEGYQVLSKEENSRLAARQQKFINSLENALIRIENKSYGICYINSKAFQGCQRPKPIKNRYGPP